MARFLTLEEKLTLICSSSDTALNGDAAPHRVTTRISPFSLFQQLTIPRLLKQHGIDVYHSTYYLMPYRPQVPAVLTVYDLIPVLFPHSVGPRARLLFRLTHRLALAASTAVIAISQATAKALLTHYRLSPEKTRVIPLGVSDVFRPAARKAVEAVRKKYGLPCDFVLYVGINKPHKNLPMLVRAWEAAPKGSLPLLAIAGPWDSRYDEVKRLIELNDLDSNVRLIGPIPDADLPALYSAARIFVFPSLYEGFGLPVLESMACGTPVVCSNIPALREVAGSAATYFDPEDQDSIAQAVSTVGEDKSKREEMTEAGLSRSRSFTWEAAAAATIEVYRWVLEAKASGGDRKQ